MLVGPALALPLGLVSLTLPSPNRNEPFRATEWARGYLTNAFPEPQRHGAEMQPSGQIQCRDGDPRHRPRYIPRCMHPAAIGSFEFERELGRGGMGEVYFARDTRLARPVAIKALSANRRMHSADGLGMLGSPRFGYRTGMRRTTLGVLLGVVVGAVDVGLMLPLSFPDKATALTAAFCSRFAIGFLAANVTLPCHQALAGELVGLLVSIPDALTTKAYAPILITGLVFGALSGWAARKWGQPLSTKSEPPQ